MLYLFFFSSRRRHTRCSRDWSSDVCSSDLIPVSESEVKVVTAQLKRVRELNVVERPATGDKEIAVAVWTHFPVVCTVRSEEHTSELQSRLHLVCRLLLEKKKKTDTIS